MQELLHGLLGCVMYAVTGGFLLSTYVDSDAALLEDDVRSAGIAMGVSGVDKELLLRCCC